MFIVEFLNHVVVVLFFDLIDFVEFEGACVANIVLNKARLTLKKLLASLVIIDNQKIINSSIPHLYLNNIHQEKKIHMRVVSFNSQ